MSNPVAATIKARIKVNLNDGNVAYSLMALKSPSLAGIQNSKMVMNKIMLIAPLKKAIFIASFLLIST